MNARFGDKKRETKLSVGFADGYVTFASKGDVLLACNPHLLVQEVIRTCAPHDNKMKRWKQILMTGGE